MAIAFNIQPKEKIIAPQLNNLIYAQQSPQLEAPLTEII